MTAYLGGLCAAALSFIFIVFAIGSLGYLVGGIKIKGIELGTAGVLLIALLYGILINNIPYFDIGGVHIELWNASIKTNNIS